MRERLIMASREKRALSTEENESNAKKSRVVEQEGEDHLEDIELELEQDLEEASLPDSDTYDLSSDEDGDVQEPEDAKPVTENNAQPKPLSYSEFIEQENEGFVKRFKEYDLTRLPDGSPDPGHVSYLEEKFGFLQDDEKFEADSFDDAPYHHRRHCLWPRMYNVIREYKLLKPDKDIFEIGLLHESTMSENFAEKFEDSLHVLMREPRPSSFAQTPEEIEKKLAYEHRRKLVLQELSIDFHHRYSTKPGSLHKYAYMFPVHFTYELIDYICTAMQLHKYPLMFLKNESEKFYPEYDEISMEARKFFEKCFLMDTSLQTKFLDKVEEGAAFEDNDEIIVGDLYEQMGMIFCYVFEEFVCQVAKTAAARDVEYAYLDGVIPADSFLRQKTAEEMHKKFQEDFKCLKVRYEK